METQEILISDDIARRAANWWFDQLDGKSASMGGGTLASTFFDKERQGAASLHVPTEEQREAFVTSLIGEIKAEAARRSSRHVVVVTVDYDPDDMLANACASAGVDPVGLPPKTTMWIDADGIRAKRGYGAQITPLT